MVRQEESSASSAMASLQELVAPVLVLMRAMEVSLLSLGQLLWRHTQCRAREAYGSLHSRAAVAYEGVKRRASDTCDNLQVKAGDTYKEVQGRTAEACQRWLNRASLLYIQSQLCLSLAFHRWQFQLSLLAKNARHRLTQSLHLDVALKDFQNKVTMTQKWARLKMAGWKRSAAHAAKVNLERASRKAREYESVFSDDFHRLRRSSSTSSSSSSIFSSSTQRLHDVSQGTAWRTPSTPSAAPDLEDTTTTTTAATTTPPGEDQTPQDVPEHDSGVTSRASAGHDTLTTQHLEAPRLPSLPPALPSDPPPRPPERPPKKPTLRSLFHGQNPEAAVEPPDRTASDADPRRVDDSNGECRNLSPARPYYYRKPPAPDPPKSPPAPACPPPPQPTAPTTSSPKLSRSSATLQHASSAHPAHLAPPTTTTSRSSTPDLPPPPPIPDEVLISDEPLPPPPTPLEVATPMVEAPPLPPESPPRERLLGTPPLVPRENGKNLSSQQTYHKDSYMAHRRDWKTGFEGRYRRTISPSGSSRNLVSSSVPATSTTATNQASLHSASSTITATTTTTTFTSSAIMGQNDALESENIASENGWISGSHTRNTSTTVSFTAEELRAFKARRAYAQDVATHTPDKENPNRKLHPSQSSPSLSSSTMQSVASEGSTSSLASGGTGSSLGSGRSVGSICSGGVSPVSPSKLSPAHSWRTSLESLNRANSSTVSSSINNGNSGSSSSHSPRAITRATSLADPLHYSEEVGMSGRATQDSYQLPRTASISESLSRIGAISDSLSRSTSVADTLAGQPLTTETYNHGSSTGEVLLPGQSVVPPSLPLAPASPTSPVAHDGPVTACPATVTEEAASPTTSSIKTPQIPSLITSKSPASPKSTSFTTHAHTNLASKLSSPVTSTNTSECTISTTTTTTSSSSSSMDSSVVVLGYGRTPNQEEIECDRLSQDYVPQFIMDNKLRALLAPGPEHKTTAHYMRGVFNLELRKDFISSSHARHPDLVKVGVSQTTALKAGSTTQNNTENTNGVDVLSNRTQLPADSAYFTTSESKAKMLTRLRGSSGNLQEPLTDQQLNKKKEELVTSIGRKLEILRAEREAIKDEMRLNHDLGAEVTTKVEAMARLSESEKYKLHVEEIDKITSLLLGLSGRLARVENALMMVDNSDPEERRILESKREKLSEQLEEAKKLKENIDRRAVQVSKVLNKYLSEDQYADYDHFIKMKAKLIMDAREIDDKIKLGEEQEKALRETMFKKQ